MKISWRFSAVIVAVALLVGVNEFYRLMDGTPAIFLPSKPLDQSPDDFDTNSRVPSSLVRAKHGSLQDSLPDDYKVCRVTPHPVMGEEPVAMKGHGLPIWYQCAGKSYDEFMHKVYNLVLQKQQQETTAQSKSRWGRRKYIAPVVIPKAVQEIQRQHHNGKIDPLQLSESQKANYFKTTTAQKVKQKRHRRILIIGNSHTRQMASTVLWQYKGQINGSHAMIMTGGTTTASNASKKNVAHVYHLPENHLTIYVLVNHPFVYGRSWKVTLEIDILHHPLQALDAIVLGTFNRYSERADTKFVKAALDYQRRFPQQGVDFEHIPAPTVQDIARVYAGPLIWVSMFAGYNAGAHKESLAQIDFVTLTHNRTNLRSVNGRNYIQELGGDECSSNVGDKVTTCAKRSTSVYKNGHRCTGAKGGQSDLIAWDVVEALHDVLQT